MTKRDEVIYHPVSAIVERATPKAVLLHLEGEEDTVWVPRSVCEGGDSLMVNDDEDIRIAEWWMKKNGLL